MTLLRASKFLLLVSLSGCVPAHLEKVVTRNAHQRSGTSKELARAFEGAEDPAAKNALGEWLEMLSVEDRSQRQLEVEADGSRYQVRFHPADQSIYADRYFDRLEPASHYEVKGVDHHHDDGAGVPLLGYRANHQRAKVESWYPPEGIYRSVTAVAIPDKENSHKIEIQLINRHQIDKIRIGGKEKYLADDFTVPWAALLENARPLGASGITSVIRQHSDRKAGFYLMEDYDPKRTPIIFVHGLFSTPLAWAQITNEIWADPELRSRYQIWHYLYPTHAAALYSARVMRNQLDELRAFLDPGQKDPAMQRTVVVAHSMGGLLAKTLVVEPRDAYWDVVFTRPLSSLNVTPREHKTLEEAFYWKPRGHVDRVIYCSVPFLGSNWATSWIGQIGSLLVAPDNEFQDFYREVERKNPGMLTDDYKGLTKSKVTSVGTLTPKQRSMDILAALKPVPGTASHVIAGSHDLFVKADSSAIPYAESSLTVNTGHGSFRDPKAIAEIIRILRLPPVSKNSGARKTAVSRTR